MAIKASCPYCSKGFTAPEEYRGARVECPKCHRRFVLKTPEEVEAALEEERRSQKKHEEDKEKIELLERLASRSAHRAGKPYYEEFQTGTQGVRHFHPRSPSKFLRLRNLSDFLLLGAYVQLLLCATGLGAQLYLLISGVLPGLALFLVLAVAWMVVGTSLYLLLKCLAEAAFLLSEVGDQQNDIVQILLDLRDNTDRDRADGP